MKSKSTNPKNKKTAKTKAEVSDIDQSKTNLKLRKEALKKIIRYLSTDDSDNLKI